MPVCGRPCDVTLRCLAASLAGEPDIPRRHRTGEHARFGGETRPFWGGTRPFWGRDGWIWGKNGLFWVKKRADLVWVLTFGGKKSGFNVSFAGKLAVLFCVLVEGCTF